VSTILNALKKLEQEQDRLKGRSSNSRRTLQRAVRSGWIQQVGLRWGVLGLGMIAIGAGLIFSIQRFLPRKDASVFLPLVARQQSSQPPPSASIPRSQSQPVAQARLSSQKHTKTVLPPTPDDGTQSGALPAHDSSRTDSQNLNPATGGRRSTQPIVSKSAQSMTAPSRGPVAASSAAGPKTSDDIAGAGIGDSQSSTSESNGTYENAQRLTNGRLKVQAIAWASDQRDRMAVINNHIVHEGHVVDGFSIILIKEDAVVVKEGRAIYMVPFGRP
jgi:hypothetical protein